MGRCDPLGYPRNMYVNGRAFEFIQTPRKILQAFDWTHNYREIWTNNITLPEDPDPRWYGWAVGKWEGDTFVITSKDGESTARLQKGQAVEVRGICGGMDEVVRLDRCEMPK